MRDNMATKDGLKKGMNGVGKEIYGVRAEMARRAKLSATLMAS